MTKQELLTDEFYVGDWRAGKVIFRFNYSLNYPTHIINAKDMYELSKNGCCDSRDIIFRKATEEEKHWLNVCINANKTIPYNEALKTFKSNQIFKKDDYIVTLSTVKDIFFRTSKNNFCVKQRENSESLKVYKDLDCVENGHYKLTYDKKHFLIDWRYATQEEKEEYDRLNKPFDVTTLKPKEPFIKVGDLISFEYEGNFYKEALIVQENDRIYILNNCHKNNYGHSDKSKYEYSLSFFSINGALSFIKNVKIIVPEKEKSTEILFKNIENSQIYNRIFLKDREIVTLQETKRDKLVFRDTKRISI